MATLPAPISFDARAIAGLRLAGLANHWVAVTCADGSAAYLVPSQRDPGRLYTTSTHHCTCADFQKRTLPCKHVYAVCLHLAVLAALNSDP
jgi:hypothetical protein